MEAVAVVPALLLAAVVAWQLVLAGHTLWLCANAARAAARADAVGRDAQRAARSALPRSLEDGLRVSQRGEAIRVELRMPLLVRAWSSPLRVAATTSLGGGG